MEKFAINKFQVLAYTLGLSAYLFACDSTSPTVGDDSLEGKIPPFDSLFELGSAMGELGDKDMDEVSGMVASRAYPGFFWVHNDSGDEPRLFLIDQAGDIKGRIHLATVQHRDWEDIAIGPGPEFGKDYIYVAEIGDNEAVYDDKYIYRFVEPDLTTLSPTGSKEITEVETLHFVFEDGARDAETLLLDPLDSNLYVVSKREDRVSIYSLGPPTAEMIARKAPFQFTFRNTTAGDISKDGTEILIKTYDSVYYWQREQGMNLLDLLGGSPKRLPYVPEPQGESICWSSDNTGYYTLSEWKERKAPEIFFYARKPD